MQRNWAGNQTFAPSAELRPASAAELAQLVAASPHVRVLGSRHSFSRAAEPAEGGALLELTGLAGAPQLDAAVGRVRVPAGCTYGSVVQVLEGSAWSLPQLASLPHISVGGAVATATHGSGVALQCLSGSVTALTVVCADGRELRVSREADGDAFNAWPVHLGLLGVVTEVELALVPAFELRTDVYCNLPFDSTLDALRDVLASAYSVSLFTTWSAPVFEQCWRKSEPAALAAAGGAPATWHGGRLAAEQLHPIPGLAAGPTTPQLGQVGPAHHRLPHFRLDFTPSAGEELQSEYFVTLADGAAALRALSALRRRIAPLLLVSEVRAVAADELWMSPCYQRESLAIHFTWKLLVADVEALLPAVEAALAPFGARPHWGKLFSAPAGHLYPRVQEFRELAASLDPAGKFQNGFWRMRAGVI